jgi:hypothetical protein
MIGSFCRARNQENAEKRLHYRTVLSSSTRRRLSSWPKQSEPYIDLFWRGRVATGKVGREVVKNQGDDNRSFTVQVSKRPFY